MIVPAVWNYLILYCVLVSCVGNDIKRYTKVHFPTYCPSTTGVASNCMDIDGELACQRWIQLSSNWEILLASVQGGAAAGDSWQSRNWPPGQKFVETLAVQLHIAAR